MPYPTIEALMDDLVDVVSSAILVDGVRLPNHNYYWRWCYAEASLLQVLFPDVQERLDSEHFIQSGSEDKVFVHQLERWYGLDFSDARKRVNAAIAVKANACMQPFGD